MGNASPRRRRLIGQLAIEHRFHPDADQTELRREIGAQKLEDAINDIVANWPPLTPSQLDRLAGLLRPAGGE
ncbi:hypothetical protein [Arthrobacter sp. efr-133-R2A-120]|uniref:hypothetical protein n=1 Tax=Arthrobacter sp. efr-133-R2A-120 TaxID=3040277 RepID=UPI00254D711E|nr:hypothetical protein [Arthrobacter sp. efr-133-R2A-120]